MREFAIHFGEYYQTTKACCSEFTQYSILAINRNTINTIGLSGGSLCFTLKLWSGNCNIVSMGFSEVSSIV
jgi:hypothetical protein